MTHQFLGWYVSVINKWTSSEIGYFINFVDSAGKEEVLTWLLLYGKRKNYKDTMVTRSIFLLMVFDNRYKC